MNCLDTEILCTNAAWVGARSNDPIVFELPPVTVIVEIHSGIDVLILNPAIMWNIGYPAAWIASAEIIALAGLGIHAADLRRSIGAYELHTDGGLFQAQNSLVRREEEVVVAATSEVLDRRVRLPLVSFKAHGQIAKRFERGLIYFLFTSDS